MVYAMNRFRSKPRRGVTTVELAICIPIFFAIIFFFLESWRAMEFQQLVDHAAFEAARAAILPGASASQARTRATEIMTAAGARNATIQVLPATIDETTTNVTVSVSINYGDVGWFFQYFGRAKPLASTITLPHENARLKRD